MSDSHTHQPEWAYEIVYAARVYDKTTGQVLQDVPAPTLERAERAGAMAVEILSTR